MDRLVSNRYVIPPADNQPGITLEKGDVIIIPIQGLHHDPEHFPNPEKFDPDRFSPENKHQIKPLTYLPFGSGSRNCIGKSIFCSLFYPFSFSLKSRYGNISRYNLSKDICAVAALLFRPES